MIKHSDGSVTLTKEENEANAFIAAAFNEIIPHLESIVNIMDQFEENAGKVDKPNLFKLERVN